MKMKTDPVTGLQVPAENIFINGYHEYWLIDKASGKRRIAHSCYSTLSEARLGLLNHGIRATHYILDIMTGEIV